MIKRDVIEWIYQQHGGMSRQEVRQNVDRLMDEIRRAVVTEGSLVISGFGTFKLKDRPARDVTLPDGSIRSSTSDARIRFFPAQNLKDFVNAQSREQDAEPGLHDPTSRKQRKS